MNALLESFAQYFSASFVSSDLAVLWKFIPFVLFFEVPVYLLIFFGLVRAAVRRRREPGRAAWYPSVSCVVTCYNEGMDVQKTIRSLCMQLYPGLIQLVVIVDGAELNWRTYDAARAMRGFVASRHNRSLLVVPKWQRGGRVSSLNMGLQFATGTIGRAHV